jgi:exonuclease SbcC
LDAISEGRYQLRVEAHGLDNRGQAGLDLRVEDQRTERLRSTGSLSGGERFYVSLALALGLADVVRSESGGVQLGTLFIDEGFGSLDADVLEEVMDMLEQVRAGEDRVIGLVSHVDLLKQRIDPRISVRRDTARPGVSTLTVSV